MSWSDGFAGSVGNTPLIRIKSLSEATGCNILAKAEYMNPGGSVKDRAALSIINAAERSGQLKPGGWVVEATAGNTGIGLVHVANERGYKTLFTVPPSTSKEKVELLRTLGAEVEVCAAVPLGDPNHFQSIAKVRAEDRRGPEIWRQTGGKVDAFVTACGTGGTIAGTSTFLKSQNPNILVVYVDPPASGVLAEPSHDPSTDLLHIRARTQAEKYGSSVTEGIGSGRLYGNLSKAKVDGYINIVDQVTMDMAHWVLAKDGQFVGGSSALNLAAAVYVARLLGPGHSIVTLITETGDRYISKLYNKQFLQDKNILHRIPENLDFVATHVDVFNETAKKQFIPRSK